MSVNSATYTSLKPRSIFARIAVRQRQRMYDAFIALTKIGPSETVLDIGVTSDQDNEISNFFEALYPHKAQITAVGLDDASFLEHLYPGVKFARADARALPFVDNAFDFVFSNAVIEHVGSRKQQQQFLRELLRVSRKGVFITTPNRWFPIEFHSVLPLLHWLPPNTFRRSLRLLGKSFLANEQNLNLLSARNLAQLAHHAGVKNASLLNVRLGGWPSNLILYVRRAGRGE
jgi:ubiquinone/menaquinone biosynthesis C-methylase UbiE